MKEEDKIKYKGYCFKLDARTYELLKKEKEKTNLSWNRYFYKLIKQQHNNQTI